MDIDELSENFELLDDWEDKYRYLIDLGEKLPPFAEECRTDEWKVSGCQSQVWLVPSFVREGNDGTSILSATATPPSCAG